VRTALRHGGVRQPPENNIPLVSKCHYCCVLQAGEVDLFEDATTTAPQSATNQPFNVPPSASAILTSSTV
jgi:hypothetical protein